MTVCKVTARCLRAACVSVDMKAETKDEAIDELLSLLKRAGFLDDPQQARDDVFARERMLSTGLKDGIALPHAKSAGVKEVRVAIGIKPGGIEFDSLDGQPARIIFLVVSPADKPSSHLQCLAEITGACANAALRRRLLEAGTGAEVVALLGG